VKSFYLNTGDARLQQKKLDVASFAEFFQFQESIALFGSVLAQRLAPRKVSFRPGSGQPFELRKFPIGPLF
jgi:hypothetical protein